MGKALTKEDLIYILQVLLQISDIEHNALARVDDGLFVPDYRADLQTHTEDGISHITKTMRGILEKLSVSEKDELLYNGNSVMTFISKAENNALSMKEDGLYAPVVEAALHIQDSGIHVTPDDKKAWDSMLKDAKTFFKEEMDSFSYGEMIFTQVLPATNPQEKAIYFLANNPDRMDECTFTLHVWRDGKWHTLGVTKNTLKDYITADRLSEILEEYSFDNKSVLEKIGEGEDGSLLFDGQPALDAFAVSDDKDNAIEVRNNRLYAKDYTQQINALSRGGFTKVNLYNDEIHDVGTYYLKDTIDNYSLILIDYSHHIDGDSDKSGCIKTAIVDVDTLNDIYSEGKTYMLEYGYSVLTSHIQLTIHEDKLSVSYQRNVNIVKITGIGRSEE